MSSNSMSARDAVLKVLTGRKNPIDAETLLTRVTTLTKRNLKPTSLTVTISNLRKEGFKISHGPKFKLV